MNRFLFCPFLLLFLLITPSKAEVFTTADGYKFEVNLIPDKSEIMLSEPVFLSFEIKNLSSTDLTFPEGGDYRNRLGRPESYKIQATRTDGKEVHVPEIKFNMGGLVGFRKVVKNGGTTNIRLFLPLWSPFSETGNYNITCHNFLGITNVENKPANLRPSGQDGVPVIVKTKIKVVKKDYFKLGQIINYWGQKLSKSASWESGYEALKVLENIDDARIRTPLIKAVQSEQDFGAKGLAIRLLAKFNDDASLKAIISQANHFTNSVRSDVVNALSFSQHPKAFDYLLKFKDDNDKFVRLSVMQALGRKGTNHSIELIKEMLKEERNKELFEFVKLYLEKSSK